MSKINFSQFKLLLEDKGVHYPKLLDEVRFAIRSYRGTRLAHIIKESDEEAYKQIFDEAYALARERRNEQRRPKEDGGTPNSARVEKLTSTNVTPAKILEAKVVYFYFQIGVEDTEHADQISAALFGGQTFWQAFDRRLRELRIDVPSTGDGLDSFHFGGVRIHLAGGEDARPLPLAFLPLAVLVGVLKLEHHALGGTCHLIGSYRRLSRVREAIDAVLDAEMC